MLYLENDIAEFAKVDEEADTMEEIPFSKCTTTRAVPASTELLNVHTHTHTHTHTHISTSLQTRRYYAVRCTCFDRAVECREVRLPPLSLGQRCVYVKPLGGVGKGVAVPFWPSVRIQMLCYCGDHPIFASAFQACLYSPGKGARLSRGRGGGKRRHPNCTRQQ